MRIASYIHALARGWVIIFICVVLGGIGGGVRMILNQPSYISSATVYFALSDEAVAKSESLQLDSLVKSLQLLSKTPAIAEKVSQTIARDLTSAEFAKRVTVTAPLGTSILEVIATDESSTAADNLSNATANQLVKLSGDLAARDSKGRSVVNATMVVNGKAKTAPWSIVTVAAPFGGAMLGLLIGCAIVLSRAVSNSRVRATTDILEPLRTPILGEMPAPGAVANASQDSLLHSLADSLSLISIDTSDRIFAFTSLVPDSVRAMAARQLAELLGGDAKRTLIIDLDPTPQPLTTSASNEPGLLQILAQTAILEDVVKQDKGIDYVASGGLTIDMHQHLSSQRMVEFLTEIKEKYHSVFVLIPHLLPSKSDADAVESRLSQVAQIVDALVLVVTDKTVRRDDIFAAAQIIKKQKKLPVGIVRVTG